MCSSDLDGGATWRGVAQVPGTTRAYSFASPCAVEGGTTLVRVTARDENGGNADQTAVVRELTPLRLCLPGEIPIGTGVFAFLPVVPNPARGTATFRYERAGQPFEGSPFEDVAIYDAAGKRLRVLDLPSGESQFVIWDGRDEDGHRMPNGVYFAKLRLDDQAATQRFVLLAE